jgi:hypothetical protein
MARAKKPAAPPVASIESPKPADPDAEFRRKLDRCGFLLAEYARNKPWLDELKRIKNEIRAHYKDFPPAAPIRAEGDEYWIDLTACEKQREVTDPQQAFEALKNALGLEKLIASLQYTFKLLDDHVPAAAQQAFVKESRSAARDISAVVKVTAKAA